MFILPLLVRLGIVDGVHESEIHAKTNGNYRTTSAHDQSEVVEGQRPDN